MPWLHALSHLCGGVVFANALPHFVSGVTGRAFQSPFAKPRGKGLSSSTVNVLWGFLNLAVAYGLVLRVGTFDPRSTADAVALGLGVLLGGLMLARVFGPLHGGETAGRS